MKTAATLRWIAAALWAAFGPPAMAQTTTVTVGLHGVASDAPIFIADKKSYFREEGIAVTMTNFQSGAMMVPPLGTGQLDVGAASPSAGLYNAVARGIKIRIVADKASSPPGYGGTKLLVRKDHVDSGRYKTLADIKGMKFAMNAPGVANTATLHDALKSVGLKYSDVQTTDFPTPMDHVAALKNGSVDASVSVEPAPTIAVQSGAAIVAATDDQVSPNHQIAVLMYSESFVANKPDIASKFMRAYIRAVRFYNGALKDGRLAGPNADEVISILVEYTQVKNPSIYRAVTPTGMNPDGEVNVKTLASDADFYAAQGWLKERINVESLIDPSFARAAVRELGPFNN
jgi:NitT/TauT family transport system substrate-binding protein